MAGLRGIKDKKEMEEGQKALWASAARTTTSRGIKMHLLWLILWLGLDLKWLCSSRTLSGCCALQQSAPSANTQALIINPLKGLVRPQCSYYQMTHHYLWPFHSSPLRRAILDVCGKFWEEELKHNKTKHTKNIFLKWGPEWEHGEAERRDVMMIVARKFKQNVYLLLLRHQLMSQDREI